MNKEIRQLKGNLLLSLLCGGQIMFALTVSGLQARNIQPDLDISRKLYCFGTMLIFLFLLAVSLTFRRTLRAVFLCLLFMNMVALINYYELLLHGTVLTHQDIKNFTTALRHAGNYALQLTLPVKYMVLSLLSAVFLLTVMYALHIPFYTNRGAGFLSAAAMSALGYVVVFTSFVDIRSNGWSWELQYYTDSFVIGTLENLKKAMAPMEKPKGYSRQELGKQAVPLPGTADVRPDIILIINETYYDVDHLVDFETDVPFMSNYMSLDAYKGYAAVPYIAGGTNASEYELLTGNVISLLSTSTPFNDMNFKTCRNLTEYLKKLGYSTIAAHPWTESNYHRGTVWRELGFETTYFSQDFSELKYYGKRWYPSDQSVFQNFCMFYENMPEAKPRFCYLLTIQNHGGWDRNDPSLDTVHISRKNGLSDFNCEQMNEYLTCVRQTDDLIPEMIDYFSAQKRDVVLYMVGDHSPSIFRELNLESAGSEDSQKIFNLKKRQVPYFIWRNIPGTDYSSVLPENHDIDLCSLTPYALKAAGLPLSPYYHQLVKLGENIQCMTGIDAAGKNGNEAGFIKTDGMTESIYDNTQLSSMVREYFYMEYNSLQGKEREDRLFDPE